MKIGKPLLLVITPLGVAGGLYEACQRAGRAPDATGNSPGRE